VRQAYFLSCQSLSSRDRRSAPLLNSSNRNDYSRLFQPVHFCATCSALPCLVLPSLFLCDLPDLPRPRREQISPGPLDLPCLCLSCRPKSHRARPTIPTTFRSCRNDLSCLASPCLVGTTVQPHIRPVLAMPSRLAMPCRVESPHLDQPAHLCSLHHDVSRPVVSSHRDLPGLRRVTPGHALSSRLTWTSGVEASCTSNAASGDIHQAVSALRSNGATCSRRV
jgi:hypothetical protein